MIFVLTYPAQECLLYLGVVRESRAGVFQDNVSCFQNVTPIRDLESRSSVLLHHEYGDAPSTARISLTA